jgi:hypothetical protein
LVEVLTTGPAYVPDVYFAPGYGRVDALDRNGEWLTIADPSGTWQMPIVLTDLGAGLREATSPYGYSGIHVTGGATDAAAAWDSARAILRDFGVVSLFLRFSPMDPASVASAAGFEGLDVDRIRTTYLVRTDEPDRMWDRMEGRARTAIRKARRQGLTGLVRPFTAEDVRLDSTFRRLYDDTMRRVGASQRYSFDDAYFRGLFQALGAGIQVVEVRDADATVASALMMRHADRAHYHLSGSTLAGSRRGANALLVWSMLDWCASVGATTCHLGGGRSEGDGLAQFKRSFGGDRADFHVGRCVIDQAAYARLTQTRADSMGTTAKMLEDDGYFPAFRASPR